MKTMNTTRLAALALGIAAIAGCSNSGNKSSDSAAGSLATDTLARTDTTVPTDTAGSNDVGRSAMSSGDTTKALTVADVKLGKSVDTQKKMVNETGDFMPMDTVYMVVHTTGMGHSAKLNVRVNSEDGKVVTDHSETISPMANDTYTDFHLSKKSGLKLGKYTVHVTLNGSDVQTKDFTVKTSS